MDKPITIYGALGSGSVPIEAALTLIGLPYQVIERAPLGAVAPDEAAYRINPMRQVPALVFPGGELMTESAAMLIWLADRYLEARLAPGPMDRKRPAFLRWMSFISSAIYALFWIRDDPSRLSADPAEQSSIRARTAPRDNLAKILDGLVPVVRIEVALTVLVVVVVLVATRAYRLRL